MMKTTARMINQKKKGIQFLLIFFFLITGAVGAQTFINSDKAVLVKAGKVLKTGILADVQNRIFIELLKDERLVNKRTENFFTGEMLPPSIIAEPPDYPPKLKMKEVISFEFIGDSGAPLRIVSSFYALPEREKIKMRYNNPEGVKARYGAKVIIRIPKTETVNRPALWHYDPQDESWERMGGFFGDSSNPEIQLFITTINRTGFFTLWDEDAEIEYTLADIKNIELVEASPYPSVLPVNIDVKGLASGRDKEDYRVENSLVENDFAIEAEGETIEDQSFGGSGDVASSNSIDEGRVIPSLEPLQNQDLRIPSQNQSGLTDPQIEEETSPSLDTEGDPLRPSAPLEPTPEEPLAPTNLNDQSLPEVGSKFSIPWVLILAIICLASSFYLTRKSRY